MNIRDAVVQRWKYIWILVLMVGSVFFVAATILYTDAGIGALGYFNLAFENNFGAWWSGILLLVAAVHMYDGFKRWEGERPSLARGWAVLSLIAVALSADEIASLHERIGVLLPWGSWANLLPFAIVLVGLFAYAIVSLWSAADLRGRVVLIIIGFALFGLAAVQEYIEHALAWEGLITPGIRVAIEESTELLGMLLIIWAALPNTQGLFRPVEERETAALEAPFAWRMAMLIFAVVAMPILAVLSDLWMGDQRGRPAEWIAAALFFLAATAAARGFSRTDARAQMWSWALLGASVFASAVAVGLGAIRPYLLLAAAAVTVAAWLLSHKGGRGAFLAAGALLVVVIAAPLVVQNPLLQSFAPLVAGMITYWGNTRLYAAETADARRSRASRPGKPADLDSITNK